MAESPRRYSFDPVERRGLLLGLEATQIGAMGAGILTAIGVGRSLPGPMALPGALTALVASAMFALCPIGGRVAVSWVAPALAYLRRQVRGREVTDTPLEGGLTRTRCEPKDGSSDLRPSMARLMVATRPGVRTVASLRVEIVEVAAEPGAEALGAIRDRVTQTWSAIVPVSGRSFSLLDVGEQVQLLDSWRAVLGAMGRPGSPVRRIQWVQRSAPTGRCDLDVPSPPGGDDLSPAVASYRELAASAGPTAQAHQVWVVLSVGAHRRSAPNPQEALRREIRLLEGQLRNAELAPQAPLLASAVEELLDVPTAVEEGWSSLRCDGLWHATYWVSEWPLTEVHPDFLAPLLIGQGRRTVSLVMAPVPTDRAVRQARSARTADLADAELRRRAGFLQSARRDREAGGAVRREAELADGHQEFRFSGYVTVSAVDEAALQLSGAELEHAAQSARIGLKRLYGRQREAYGWTLPLGRGLR